MKRQERALKIAKILQKLYPKPTIPLEHESPYTLLIAVLLSAQCTDKRVNEVTPFLFKKANTPKKMVKLSIDQIQEIIKPCGLSKTKAKAIHLLSEMLLEDFDGTVPNTFEELEKFPGVGHKTASVVMAQAFKIPAFPVDTHIYRCARRWGLSRSKTVKGVEEDLKKLYPKKKWIDLHLQIIYCAREFCQARGHKEDMCPICKWLIEVDPKVLM
ncbi:MAG: endonuclease III [Parachlamydiales bacterium]|nr:endonuclease III [Parachlamydiales bacterium]